MREDFWPFVSACAVVICSCLLVGAYAVKRTWFTDQKVNFVPPFGTYLTITFDIRWIMVHTRQLAWLIWRWFASLHR